MTSKAYCFYCFECLSASFERREPPSLESYSELYEEYRQTSQKHQSPLRTGQLVNGASDGDYEDSDDVTTDEEGDEEDEQTAKQVDGSTDNTHSSASYKLRLPSISRLQTSTPASSSHSSSSSTTPSLLSASSSNSQLTAATSTSTLSSNRQTYSSRLSVTSSYPLFVTWNTVSLRSGTKSLRGCIGTFEPLPLTTGLQTYALTSAFEDTRFSPIPQSQLATLSCSLTLLADFENCSGPMDWILGTHGLRISFNHRGRRHGATYLPDVAVEQGWNMEETLESLMRKAGWDGSNSGGVGMARRILRAGLRDDSGEGPKKPWEEVADFKVVRYTGLKASAGYKDWRSWRDWVDQREREKTR